MTGHVFISYVRENSRDADRLEELLREAGIPVWRDTKDLLPGDDWQAKIRSAINDDSLVFLACFSRDSAGRTTSYQNEELDLAIGQLHQRRADERWLIPVRFDDCQIPDLRIGFGRTLASLQCADLFGADRGPNGKRLVRAVRSLLDRASRQGDDTAATSIPAITRAGPASTSPRAWHIPARNPDFRGRDELLTTMRDYLLARDHSRVVALHGLNGVGKTQLAIEFAHRFAADYDVAWWIPAEQAALIDSASAALGVALDRVPEGVGGSIARLLVTSELRQRGRWLLVFDNVTDPAAVAEWLEWLPDGEGHVLVTSLRTDWRGIASPVHVDVLARHDSIRLIRAIAGRRLDETGADRLAHGLGDHPLAVTQAAEFIAYGGMDPERYLAELKTRAAVILQAQGPSPLYQNSLAAAILLTADKLHAVDPSAIELAHMCAFYAAEPIPDRLLEATARRLAPDGEPDPLLRHKMAAQLVRRSLARNDGSGLQFHTLTQAIFRDNLDDQAADTRAHAEAALAASSPGAPGDPATWPRWSELMPHLLAADLEAGADPGLRSAACDLCWYLLAHGDARPARELATRLSDAWLSRLGADDAHTLMSRFYLAWALGNAGRAAEAKALEEDTLARRRRLLGPDHQLTLASASNLAGYLDAAGELSAARYLAQGTLDRQRALFGEDHGDALTTASRLAGVLGQLGDKTAALELDEMVFEGRRRSLGENHPDTLTSGSALSATLTESKQFERALTIAQEVLARRREVLGEDHPDTLNTADNLANVYGQNRDFSEARELAEDTLARRRRVQGEDHLRTLVSALNLATTWSNLADDEQKRGAVASAHAYQIQASELAEDTWQRMRSTLGPDHPLTLLCASDLVRYRQALNDPDAAALVQEEIRPLIRAVLGPEHPGIFVTGNDMDEYRRVLAEKAISAHTADD